MQNKVAEGYHVLMSLCYIMYCTVIQYGPDPLMCNGGFSGSIGIISTHIISMVGAISIPFLGGPNLLAMQLLIISTLPAIVM